MTMTLSLAISLALTISIFSGSAGRIGISDNLEQLAKLHLRTARGFLGFGDEGSDL